MKLSTFFWHLAASASETSHFDHLCMRCLPWRTLRCEIHVGLRGHPYMTSAHKGEGGGVSPKEDVVKEVA